MSGPLPDWGFCHMNDPSPGAVNGHTTSSVLPTDEDGYGGVNHSEHDWGRSFEPWTMGEVPVIGTVRSIERHFDDNGSEDASAATGPAEHVGLSASDAVADHAAPELETLRERILEEARAQALYESGQLREQARLEAEQLRETLLEQYRAEAKGVADQLLAAASADAERVRAEAHSVQQGIVQQAREQAAYEAGQLRDEVQREAEALREARLAEIREEADREAARLREAAAARLEHETALQREAALAEAEQIKAAIIEHWRTKADEDAGRMEAEFAEAVRLRDSILAEARAEATRLREEAEAEIEQLRAAAEEQFTPDGSDTDGSRRFSEDAAVLSATEIGGRDFPRVRHGFDPESVRKWLKVVELSHAILEEELDRARAEWERALEVLAVTRIYLAQVPSQNGCSAQVDLELDRARQQWERSVDRLAIARSERSDSSVRALLVRTAQLETQLGRRPMGYSASQVRSLLDSAAAQLARLENQVGRLRGENEELRARMLQQVASPAPQAPKLPAGGVFVQMTSPLTPLDGRAD